MVNGSYDYKPLKATSTPSAVSGRPMVRALSLVAKSSPPSRMVGRRPFKGRALKPLHLNAVRDKEEGKDREDEEKKVRVSLKNGTEKDRKKSRCGKCQGSPGRQQQQQQQQQEQRRAHEIGGDQHKCDMADSIMSSRHAARGTAESGRLSSLTVSKRYQPMKSNTVDKSSGITLQ